MSNLIVIFVAGELHGLHNAFYGVKHSSLSVPTLHSSTGKILASQEYRYIIQ